MGVGDTGLQLVNMHLKNNKESLKGDKDKNIDLNNNLDTLADTNTSDIEFDWGRVG